MATKKKQNNAIYAIYAIDVSGKSMQITLLYIYIYLYTYIYIHSYHQKLIMAK